MTQSTQPAHLTRNVIGVCKHNRKRKYRTKLAVLLANMDMPTNYAYRCRQCGTWHSTRQRYDGRNA